MKGIIRNTVLICFLALALASNAAASMEEALQALQAADYEKAFQLLKPEADAGNPQAQFLVCDFYLQGVVVPKNEKIALGYVTRSAEAGFPPAIAHLASFHRYGFGMVQDIEKSMELYRQADSLGVPEAAANLSGIYLGGIEVEQDFDQAFKYARRAVELGSPHGAYNLGVIYLNGMEPNADLGSDLDISAAVYWIEQAANAGLPDAALLLGKLYSDKVLVKANFTKALYWSSLAVAFGVEEAKEIRIQSELSVTPGARKHVEQQLAEWRPKPVRGPFRMPL